MAMHTLSDANPHLISAAAAEFQRLLNTRRVPDEPERMFPGDTTRRA